MKYPYIKVALPVFFGIVTIAILGNHFELTKSDWSGWVQAIGSIAAILGAFYIADTQTKQALKVANERQERDDRRRVDIVDALLSRIYDLADEMHRQSRDSNVHYFHGFNQSVLIDLRESIKTIPMMEVPYAEIVFHITALPHALEEVALVFRNVRSDGEEDPTTIYERLFATDLEQRIDDLLKLTTEARTVCLHWSLP